MSIEKYEEAIVAYQKAIQLNPQYAGAYYNLGFTLDKQEKYEEAIARLPKSHPTQSSICKCLLQSGLYFR